MANEETDFKPFIEMTNFVINELNPGNIYFVVDKVSKDKTLELCQQVAIKDPRYITIWAPENRNLVDAYIKGLRVAYEAGHEIIIEMDAGLSQDPRAIPMFLRVLNEGNECAFGSRFINGGSMRNSPFKRRFLSKTGTILAKVLLGAKLHDMTSGYQGFHRDIVEKIINYNFKSKAHFYQTELRYLLRKRRICEVPIHYQAPSPRVSKNAIRNAYQTLLYYFFLRLCGKAKEL
ncbi:MAG: dolichol-phosphate mannosyltransferase [Gammaproteobacteria bacterium RIFCSPHIGHO2_12_FULL_37_14]|nr:MAG: dolichol-phosphate mannosyltransferase [Gammaproteobacteria bacterium RIFCSPHIGHO2_12_FULL_37_14]